MSHPFGRENAAKRAEMSRNAALSYRTSLLDAQDWLERAENESDRLASARHVEMYERTIAFHLAQAEAYDRIAKGLPPYET